MAYAKIVEKKYAIPRTIKESKRYKQVIINDILPFRVRFRNVTVPGYGPSNVPPIGIAIIGFNNYIL